MKKAIKVFLALTLLFICISNPYALGYSEQTDPNKDFHSEIDEILESKTSDISNSILRIDNQIESATQEYQKTLIESYDIDKYNLNPYNNFLKGTTELNNDIQKTQDYLSEINQLIVAKNEYILEKLELVKKELENLDFINVEINYDANSSDEAVDSISLLAAPTSLKVSSVIAYYPSTKEFYYYVEYVIDLTDDWDTYDFVSMQLKDENGWYWNDIIVTTFRRDYGFDVMSGKASKYGVISGNDVYCRADFWSGNVFAIRDGYRPTMFGTQSYINKIIVQGWLQVTGSSTSNQVKSDFEHNYKYILPIFGAEVTSVNLDKPTFKMSISYKNEQQHWAATAGSWAISIPSTTNHGNAIAVGKKYYIKSSLSNKCVSVKNASNFDGALVQQYSKSSSHSQKWQFIPLGNDLFKIKDVNSGRLLSITGSSSENSAWAWTWQDDGTNGQIFKIKKINQNGSMVLMTKCSNYSKVLDVSLAAPGYGTGEGDQLNQFQYNATNNQIFYIEMTY